MNLVLGIGLLRAPNDFTIHIPPDLRSGAAVGVSDPHPANVYAFAFYIFQQLYRWPNDGAEDFAAAIYKLSPYFTANFRAKLLSEMELKGKRGELAMRERGIQQIQGRGYEEARVDILGGGSWTVWLDLLLQESVQGMAVKEKLIRYPLRVVRYEVDFDANPWGLALDGFDEPGPQPITDFDSSVQE